MGEVHALFSGKPAVAAQAEFKNDRWQIQYGGRPVGELPELPDMGDFLPVLRTWAKSLQQEFPSAAPAGSVPPPGEHQSNEAFLPDDLFATLGRLGELWDKSRGDETVLQQAARALVSLQLQTPDYMEVADLLGARALGTLAAAEALAGKTLSHEECLLGHSMDYQGFATRACSALLHTDPALLLADQECLRLQRLAAEKDADDETRYLALLCRSAWDKHAEWDDLQRAYFPQGEAGLPVLRSGLLIGRFESNEAVAVAILQKVGGHRSGGPGSGAFLSGGLEDIYFDAFSSTALFTLSLHYLDSLSSVPAADKFLEVIPRLPGAIGPDLQRWYGDLIASKKGQRAPGPLLDHLGNPGRLGLPALQRSYRELRANAPYVDSLLAPLRALAGRMDSRLKHRVFLADNAYDVLFDLRQAERLRRSVAVQGASEHPYQAAWLACFTGDAGLMASLLKDDRYRREAFRRVIQEGCLENLPEQLVLGQFQRIARDEEDDWEVRSQFVHYLQRKKDFAAAHQVIQKWLDSHDADNWGLDWVRAHNAQARTYYLDGRYREGYQAVEPVVESMQGTALSLGALLLDKLAREQEAESLYRKALKRYPDSVETLADYAAFHWRHARNPQAAELLHASRYATIVTSWAYTIGRHFADTFAGQPAVKGQAAFEALKAAGIRHDLLRELADAVRKKGNPDLAFQIESNLQLGGLDGMLLRINAYSDLKRFRGRQAAWDWLRSKVAPQEGETAVLVAYDQQEPELVWDLVPDPPPGKSGEYLWLVRAASSLLLGKTDPNRAALVQHFSEGSGGWDFLLGRYLMGRATEAELFAQVKDPRTRCDAAYYVGLKAQVEGRLEDASDWWRVATEAGRTGMQTSRLASYALGRWRSTGVSLSRLTEKAAIRSRN